MTDTPFDHASTRLPHPGLPHQPPAGGNDDDSRLAAILDSAGEGIFAVDSKGVLTFINPRALRMIGREGENVIGHGSHALLHPRHGDGRPMDWRDCPVFATLRDGEPRHVTDDTFWRRDGTPFPVEFVSTPIRHAEDEPVGAVVVFHDTTERKRLETEVRVREARLRELLRDSPIAVAILARSDLRVLFCNGRLGQLVGLTRDTLLGRTADGFFADPADLETALGLVDAQGRIGDYEAPLVRADGERLWALLSFKGIWFADEPAVLWWAYDITGQRNARERLARLANHDPLTGLPNRRLFLENVESVRKRCETTGQTAALLYLDLDRFKTINDTYGHEFGDRLLENAARRFANVVRHDDVVARIGGDEFAILLPMPADESVAETVASKIRRAFAAPFTQFGDRIAMGVSIGIYHFSGNTDAKKAIDRADRAMYRAKRGGGNQWCVFDPQQDHR